MDDLHVDDEASASLYPAGAARPGSEPLGLVLRLEHTLAELTALRPAPRAEVDLEAVIALVEECLTALRVQ